MIIIKVSASAVNKCQNVPRDGREESWHPIPRRRSFGTLHMSMCRLSRNPPFDLALSSRDVMRGCIYKSLSQSVS
jgi:hypothetical protein